MSSSAGRQSRQMAQTMLATLTFIALAALGPAQAQNQTSRPAAFIILGDSLSDTGNYFNTRGLGNRTYPVANVTVNGSRIPAYWRGRFTNAQGNWVDRLARNARRIAVSSFAFGGGMLCPPSSYAGVSRLQLAIPDVLNQTSLYFRKLQTDARYNATISSREPIPVIWAGSNDIRAAAGTLSPLTAPALIQNLTQCMVASARVLLDKGIKTIVLGTSAPLELTPASVASNAVGPLGLFVGALNQQMTLAASTLRTAYPNATIILWDAYKDVAAAVRNHTAFGFKYGNNASCVIFAPGTFSLTSAPASVCRNPNDYVFWDDLHPTSRAHDIVTQSFINTLIDAGVGISKSDLVRPQGPGRRLLLSEDNYY